MVTACVKSLIWSFLSGPCLPEKGACLHASVLLLMVSCPAADLIQLRGTLHLVTCIWLHVKPWRHHALPGHLAVLP